MKMSDEEQRFQQELEERAKAGDKAAAAVLKIRMERLGRIRTGKTIVRLVLFCILCVLGWVLYWIFR